MEVKAETKYARISAFKVREVTREIQGLPAEAALDLVRLIPKKAALLIAKTLASAIANAENNNDLRAAGLVVKLAVAGEGPTLKRMHTRARGGGAQIHKRTSHIKIILTEAEPLPEKGSKAKGRKKEKTKNPGKKASSTKETAAPAIAQHAPVDKNPDEGHTLAAGYNPEQVTAGDNIINS